MRVCDCVSMSDYGYIPLMGVCLSVCDFVCERKRLRVVGAHIVFARDHCRTIQSIP